MTDTENAYTKKAHTLARHLNEPTAVNYEKLLHEAIDCIEQYSGQVWTNYNPSDPGITLLQNLCYTLVELGMKAGMPVADLLTQPNGTIPYTEQFVLPQQALTTTPVTASDMQKQLLNTVPGLKAAYVMPREAPAGHFFTYAVQLELLPGAQLWQPPQNTSAPDLPGTPQQTALKAAQCLHQHGQANQLYLFPDILTPVPVTVQGTIYLAPKYNLTQYWAQLLFALNNYCSAYPHFTNYAGAKAQGVANQDLFSGPEATTGHLPPPHPGHGAKKTAITANALRALLLQVPGTDFVDQLQLSIHGAPASQHLAIAPNEAPLFTWPGLAGFTIVQNNRRQARPNNQKVKAAYTRLVPSQEPQIPLAPDLPKGTCQGIDRYHSLQHQLPAQYRLGYPQNEKQLGAQHMGKIRQLKGYMALMEQSLTDFMAQAAHIGQLLSHNSGRSKAQMAAPTYHYQGLYGVPQIEPILKGDYEQRLKAAQESPNTRLQRKRKALKHLLARYGQQHSLQALNLTNPHFGDQASAEIWHMSQTLQHYSLLSQSRVRTYFAPGAATDTITEAESAPDQFTVFASGVERNLEHQLNLCGYYRGLVQQVQGCLEQMPTAMTIECRLPQPPAPEGAAEHDTDGGPGGLWIQAYPAPFSEPFPDDLDSLAASVQVRWVYHGEVIWQYADPQAQTCRKLADYHMLSSDEQQQQVGPLLTSLATPYIYALSQLAQTGIGLLWADPYRLLPWLRFRLVTKQEGKDGGVEKSKDRDGDKKHKYIALQQWATAPLPEGATVQVRVRLATGHFSNGKATRPCWIHFPEWLPLTLAALPAYPSRLAQHEMRMLVQHLFEHTTPAGHSTDIQYLGPETLGRLCQWLTQFKQGLQLLYTTAHSYLLAPNGQKQLINKIKQVRRQQKQHPNSDTANELNRLLGYRQTLAKARKAAEGLMGHIIEQHQTTA